MKRLAALLMAVCLLALAGLACAGETAETARTNCDANVRKGPSVKNDILFKLEKGTEVRVNETIEDGNDTWCYITVVSNARVGYILRSLLDFGADAHTYDPTPADILQIARADLFIYTGDGMELWAKKLLASADIAAAVERGSLRVLDLSESVPLLPADHTGAEEEHEHADHDHDEADPHIWTSFANAKAMCAAIADALTATDADGATVYAANLAAYTAKLDALDAQMQEVRDAAVRDTVCFGGSFAFVYLFDEYNLAHRSVFSGCASHTEPSPAAMLAIVEAIKASGAPAVLYDSLSEQKTAEAIAAECGVRVLRLHAIHNITKAEYDAGEDYLSLTKKNIEVLREALG